MSSNTQEKQTGTPFLTARWEHLLLLNYEVPAAWLEPLVPRGTELDPWQGKTLVSLVGFHFLDTRVRGFSIPFHRHFPEVNLRFYVRRDTPDGPRRAVVFVRELVPRWWIAAIARWVYNEPYLALPMRQFSNITQEQGGRVVYIWDYRRENFSMGAYCHGPAQPLVPGSEAEFITEHYWGYTRQRDGGTLEYQVEHPPWQVWTPTVHTCFGPFEKLYGPQFGEVLAGEPISAFVALGSPIAVYPGHRVG